MFKTYINVQAWSSFQVQYCKALMVSTKEYVVTDLFEEFMESNRVGMKEFPKGEFYRPIIEKVSERRCSVEGISCCSQNIEPTNFCDFLRKKGFVNILHKGTVVEFSD